MTDGKKVFAPFTEEQVESLNQYQNDGRFHEFTGGDGLPLVATTAGWITRRTQDDPIGQIVTEADVVQRWAWAWMADWEWQRIGRCDR